MVYERFDSLVGSVICTSRKGCYVEVDDAEHTRGFYYGNGRVGDVVLCSVRKNSDPSSYLLSLDSVLSYAPILPRSDAAA